MFNRWITFLSLVLLVGFFSPVGARTWNVEKDGSGDYTSIFWAMNAASAGDTIMIGPGRYDDFHPLVAPAWTTEAIVPVTKDNLTFIGAGNTSTIIGPTEMYLPGGIADPKAIATVEDVEAKFQNLRIENAYTGVYWAHGRVEIDGCQFSGCNYGVFLYCEGGGVVSNSGFISEHVLSYGIRPTGSCGPLMISNCEFPGSGINDGGISINGVSGTIVQDCHFGTSVGIAFSGATGSVSNCTTTETVDQAIGATSGSQVQLIDNQLHGNFASLYVNGWSVVNGSGNIFTGGDVMGTIHVCCQSHLTLNNNHILKSGDFAATSGPYFYEITTNDLTGNYWGTTDTDLIAEWIWDHNDDSTLRGYIEFLPIADGPVSTESKTLDGVKVLYR